MKKAVTANKEMRRKKRSAKAKKRRAELERVAKAMRLVQTMKQAKRET